MTDLRGLKIAVVGSGVAGLVAAHLLAEDHDVTLFEARDRPGGHSHTVDVAHGGERHAVDTGFVVFNDWTYPNFIKLLARLGVASKPSDMSFSVACESTGLEYNGTSLNTLFAQRRNLFRPSFHRMIRDILRFNSEAPALLDAPDGDLTLAEFLERGAYSREFVENYLVPMSSAVWSSSTETISGFPARYLIEFFRNHGFLSVNDRPTWRVVEGGARAYVERIVGPLGDRVRLSTPIESVRRHAAGVEIVPAGGAAETFDVVVLATHADQSLRMLADATDAERDVLSAFPYQRNDTVLHTDERLLPRRPLARASWNYHRMREARDGATVTYDMTRLQTLPTNTRYCVSLNRADAVDPSKVLRSMIYHHPVYTPAGVSAQARWDEINGVRRTYFCGAYWGYGFHEDGVTSGLRVARAFGKSLDSGVGAATARRGAALGELAGRAS